MFGFALFAAIVLMALLAAAVVAALKTLGPVLALFASLGAALIGSMLIVARLAMDLAGTAS